MRTRTIAWIVAALFLSGCGAFKVVKEPEPAPTGPLKTLKFESGNEGDEVAGWTVRNYTSDQPAVEGDTAKSKIEYTESEKRSGKMSALLRPIGKEKLPSETFTDARFCGDAPFPGFATRVSAFIKGDPGGIVRFWVSESSDESSGGQDNALASLQRRGGNWNKHEVVSVPPPGQGTGARHMCLLLGVAGSNRAWIDDVTFTKLDVATIPPGQPLALENLDMEVSQRGTLANWTLTPKIGSGQPAEGFELSADTKTKRSGRASLRLTTDVPLAQPPGDSADYCFDPNPVLGRTLRVAGWVRTDVADREGGLFGVSAFPFTPAEIPTLKPEVVLERGDSYSSHVFIRSAADWTRYEVIAFVPKSTVNLCIDVRLDQVGSVWADDVTVEVIDL